MGVDFGRPLLFDIAVKDRYGFKGLLIFRFLIQLFNRIKAGPYLHQTCRGNFFTAETRIQKSRPGRIIFS